MIRNLAVVAFLIVISSCHTLDKVEIYDHPNNQLNAGGDTSLSENEQTIRTKHSVKVVKVVDDFVFTEQTDSKHKPIELITTTYEVENELTCIFNYKGEKKIFFNKITILGSSDKSIIINIEDRNNVKRLANEMILEWCEYKLDEKEKERFIEIIESSEYLDIRFAGDNFGGRRMKFDFHMNSEDIISLKEMVYKNTQLVRE